MRSIHIAVLCSALAVFSLGPAATATAQRSASSCRAEWRANKAQNQAQGITEKAFVEQCKAGGAAAAAPAGAAPPPEAARTEPPTRARRGGGMRSARECREEWRANKAQNQAQGITERAFVEQCRAGTAAAPMGAAPAPTAAAPPPPPAAAPPPQATGTAAAPAPYRRGATPASLPRATPTPSGANQFASEGEARARCPGGAVVWVNLRSHVYHFSGYRSYGTTRRGAYMCESDATADGFRAAKNEKHPT